MVARSRKILIAVAGVVVLSSTVLLSACGEDKASASEYVGAVCGAFGDFQATLTDGQTALQEATAENSDPASAQEQLSQFFSDATSASEQAATEIEDAGTPDVENGEEIGSAINDAFNGVTEALQTTQEDVDAMPTDSAESFQSEAEGISTSFQDNVTQIADGLEQVGESTELQAAAEQNSECQALEAAPTGATGATGP